MTNFKHFLMVALGAAIYSGTYAETKPSAWVGEPMDYGHSYYLLDATRITTETQLSAKAFFSHATYTDGKVYPAYSDYAQADFFSATQGAGKYMQLHNMTLAINSDSYIVTAEKEGKQPYGTTARDFEKEYTGSEDFIFNIYYDGGRKSILSFTHNYYGFNGVQTENGTDFIVTTLQTNSNFEKKWKFISPEQYIGRPKLDAIISKVEAEFGSEGDMPDDVKSVYQAAKNTQTKKPGKTEIGKLGPEIISSYSNLTTAYNEALLKKLNKSDAEISSYMDAYTKLLTLINMSEGTVFDLVSEKSSNAATLVEALQTAQRALDAADPKTVDVATAVSNLNAATAALSSAVGPLSSPIFKYCREMKYASITLGYDFPAESQNALINAVATQKTETEIEEIITDAQSKFTDWANAQVSNGEGFPIGSDFSLFIKNNSFEMGNYAYWTVTNAKSPEVKTNTDGTHTFSATGTNNSAKISQTVSNLPNGTYVIDATVTDGTFMFNNNVVPLPYKFTIDKDHKEMSIAVYGSNINVDDFTLTLMGGLSTEYTIDEEKGMSASACTGNFSKVTIKRALANNGNWNTFCSPCDLDSVMTNSLFGDGEKAQVMEMTSIERDEDGALLLNFTYASSIEAGKAYLVKPGANYDGSIVLDGSVPMITTPVENAALQTEDEAYSVTMYGNFNYVSPCSTLYKEGYDTFVMSGNEFKYIPEGSTAKMKGFRAYFQVTPQISGTQQGSGAAMLRLSLDESLENTTSIESLRSQNADAIFNLMGRQVNAASQGIYVKSGKKFIVK